MPKEEVSVPYEEEVSPYLGGDPVEDEDTQPFEFEDPPELVAPPEPEAAEPEAAEPEAAEPEAAEPEAAEQEKKHVDPDRRIPKSRFDEVNERRKAAERKLAELEAKLSGEQQAKLDTQPEVPSTPDFDFEGKEEEYAEAVVDGDFAKAKELRKAIRAAEREQFMREIENSRDQTADYVNMRTAFDAKVAELNSEFPVFNPESSDYDEVLTQEVLAVYNGYMQSGQQDGVKMLDKAARMVAKMYDVQGAAAAEAPSAPAAARPSASKVKQKTAKLGQQPPDMVAGTGDASGPPSVLDMTEEEFDSLPESKLRALRGDFAAA